MPRWTIPFLRALERAGNARAAAEDAGIDHTTAYARRKVHEDFADAWDLAVYRFAVAKEAREAEEQEAIRFRPGQALKKAPPPPSGWSPSPANAGEDVISGGQLKRAGHDRWSRRKQEAFLAELAATGNFKRASRAVGISYEAVRTRRRKDPRLEAACQAAIAACRARIPEFLAGAAAATFDPDESAGAEEVNPLPKVTVAEAIKIAQLHGGAKQEAAPEPDDDPDYDYDGEMARLREGLVQKLQRLRRRERPKLLAQGWSYDEEYDREIPPGWVRCEAQDG